MKLSEKIDFWAFDWSLTRWQLTKRHYNKKTVWQKCSQKTSISNERTVALTLWNNLQKSQTCLEVSSHLMKHGFSSITRKQSVIQWGTWGWSVNQKYLRGVSVKLRVSVGKKIPDDSCIPPQNNAQVHNVCVAVLNCQGYCCDRAYSVLARFLSKRLLSFPKSENCGRNKYKNDRAVEKGN